MIKLLLFLLLIAGGIMLLFLCICALVVYFAIEEEKEMQAAEARVKKAVPPCVFVFLALCFLGLVLVLVKTGVIQ